jgi:hypothetical protein
LDHETLDHETLDHETRRIAIRNNAKW